MALIKCTECGKEFSDKAAACPCCGCPTREPSKFNENSKDRSYFRLILGILLIVSSLFVVYQSFFAGVSNLFDFSGKLDGTIGLSFALIQIAFGIIGIVTSKSSKIPLIMFLGFAMSVIGLVYALVYKGIYEDLNIWGWFLFATGIMFLINSFYLATAKTNHTNRLQISQDNDIVAFPSEKNCFQIIMILFEVFVIIVIGMVLYRTFINPI